MILNIVWLKIVSANMHSNPLPRFGGAFLQAENGRIQNDASVFLPYYIGAQ